MSLDTSLLIATGGLANINRQMAVVSQNVANASTPGYARGVSAQSALVADGQGMGVRTGPVLREIDLRLQADLFGQNARLAAATTEHETLARLDAVQGVPGDGNDLAGRLGAVRDAFSALYSDPGDALQQTRVVTAADRLAAQLRDMSASYGSNRQAAQDALVADVGTLNETLRQIGQLSDQVMRGRSAGISTADLENQRDVALTRLSGLLDIRTLAQPNGDLLVLSGASTLLPTRGDIRGGIAPFSIDAAVIGASSSYPGGVPGIMLNGTDVSAGLAGGTIGANLALRDVTLPTQQAELDEFARTLSDRFLSQGLRLFSDPAGQVPAGGGVPRQAGYVGYAGQIQVSAALRADPRLVRDGTDAVVDQPGGASAFTPNPPAGPVGFSALVGRVLAYGFGTELQPGVPQAATATTGLGPAGNLAGHAVSARDLAGLASGLVAALSGDTAAAAARLADEQTSRTVLQTKVTDRSGVKIDDEMSRMVALQASYAANAKLVGAVQTMWNQTLQMVA